MQILVTQKQSGIGLASWLFAGLLLLSAGYTYSAFGTNAVWFGALACLISLTGALHSAWKQDLLICIDDTGIYDKRLGIGKINWADVDDVQLQVTESNRFLCFKISNPAPYLARLKGANRERVLFHRSLGFHGFNVDVGPVDVNLLELQRKIYAHVRRPRA
jgi:hypothetical protein